MPEPEKHNEKMEELLRTYAAKRRRDSAQPELHPVNRRLLQDEVARTYGGRNSIAPGALPSLWSKLRYWLPFAATVSVFVVVVGLILSRQDTGVSPKQGTDDTKSVRQQSEKPRDSREPELATATAPAVSAPKPTEDFVQPKTEQPVRLQSVPAISSSVVPAERETLERRGAEPRPDTGTTLTLKPSRDELVLGKDKDTDQSSLSLAKSLNEPAERSLQLKSGSGAEQSSVQLSLEDRNAQRGFGAGGGGARGGASAPPNRLGGFGGGGSRPEQNRAADDLTVAQQSAVLGRSLASPTLAANSSQPSAPATASPETRNITLSAAPAQQAPGLRAAGGIVAQKFVLDPTVNSQRQRFYRATDAYRMNLNSPRPPEILNSFEFVQTGKQIQVIDGDGSEYRGQVVAAPLTAQKVETTKRESTLRVRPKAEASAPASATSQLSESLESLANDSPIYFRVSGTNKTLKRLVVFDGNVAPLPTLTQTQQTDALRSKIAAENKLQLNSQDQSTLSNSRIQGQAIYGNKQSLEINAVAAPGK